MRTYFKYIWRDIKVLGVKLLAIVFIVALGVALSVGLVTSTPNMRYSLQKFYEESNTADVIVQGPSFNKTTIEELKTNPIIEDAYGYFSFDDDIEFKNGNHLTKINVVDFNSPINKLKLIEGRFPDSDSEDIEIVVEQKQPFLIDVPLGYETTFLDKTVKVVGVVQSPWYFAYVEEISMTEQRPIEIIVYANEKLMEFDLYTHINLLIKGSNEFEMFSDKYEKYIDEKVQILKESYPNAFFQTRNMNQSFAKYKSDVKIVEAIAIIFPLFFLLITILVSMSSVTRIIEDQRTQMGTLRSLGVSKVKILMKYIIYALLSSGMGVIFGIAIGIYSVPYIIYNAYNSIYNLPPFAIRYYWDITTLISLLSIISVILVTVITVSRALNEKTTELLKIKTPKPGKKILFERITFIWQRISFKFKSTFRNIFRHKKNLILMLIGISGSTALLLAGFGIKDSVDFAGQYQYSEMMQYNIEININDDKGQFPEISQYDSTFAMSLNAQYDTSDYITLIIPNESDNINNFINFKKENKKILFNDESVIVTKQFADKHNLKVGSELLLKIESKEITFIITSIQEYYFGNNIYIAKELLNSDIELNFNKILVNAKGINKDEKEQLKEDIFNNEYITKIMFEDDLKYTFQNTSDSMYSIIVLLVIASSILAIVINYNILLINIHTRKREIATLKVLGFQEREVSGYMFRETVIISTLAILIGLVVGVGLHYFIISQVVVDGVLLSYNISWISYILTMILSFVFLIVVYLLTLPQTRKVDMMDSLKSYE